MSALDSVVARMTEATSSFLLPPYLLEGFDAVPDSALAALLAERLAARETFRPGAVLTGLIEQHGLLTVVDELAGAAGLKHVIDAYVRLVGWGDLVAAVAAARPDQPDRDPQTPEPF